MSESHATPAATMPTSEPSSIKLALTLGFAGLISGLALVAVYEWTLPIIKANQERALKAAIFKVVPGAETMRPLVAEDNRLKLGEASESAEAKVFAAYGADQRLLGYAILAEGPGFQDTIRLLFGLNPIDQRVVGMEVLESRETPGLGDKIFKDEAFVNTFRNLAIEPEIVLVKEKGTGGENAVDAITGATISSRAVVNIVNNGLDTWKAKLPTSNSSSSKNETTDPAHRRAALNGKHAIMQEHPVMEEVVRGDQR